MNTAQPSGALKLRSILDANRIPVAELARHLTQADGTRVSRAAISMMLNHGQPMKRTPVEHLTPQIASFLKARGVPCATPADLLTPEQLTQDAVLAAPEAAQPPAPEPYMKRTALSPDAYRHFGIAHDPFTLMPTDPNLDDVWFGQDQRLVREAMRATAKNGGILAIVGESGCGKSWLQLDFERWLETQPTKYVLVRPRTVDKARLTDDAIVCAVIADIDRTAKIPARTEARARKIEHLLSDGNNAGTRHVLVIDETQDITKRLLKQLKRFAEIRVGIRPLLPIILIGQPELGALLDEATNHDAREVIQRTQVMTMQALPPLKLAEYVGFKLERAGASVARVFEKGAIDAVPQRLKEWNRERTKAVSRVYPLAINNLLAAAMNEAASLGAPKVTADMIASVGARS